MRKKIVCLVLAMVVTISLATSVSAYMSQAEAIYNTFPRTRGGDVIYPDYFGGIYVDNRGFLVVLIVGPALEDYSSRADYLIALGRGRYRYVEFSLAELSAEIEVIDIAMRERAMLRCRYALNVGFYGIRTDENRISINMVEYNEAMIAGFRQYVYDSPMIIFGQGGFLMSGPATNFHIYVLVALMGIAVVMVFAVLPILTSRRRLRRMRIHDNRAL